MINYDEKDQFSNQLEQMVVQLAQFDPEMVSRVNMYLVSFKQAGFFELRHGTDSLEVVFTYSSPEGEGTYILVADNGELQIRSYGKKVVFPTTLRKLQDILGLLVQKLKIEFVRKETLFIARDQFDDALDGISHLPIHMQSSILLTLAQELRHIKERAR